MPEQTVIPSYEEAAGYILGEIARARGSLLRSGTTQSCGCLRRERISEGMQRYHYERRVVGS